MATSTWYTDLDAMHDDDVRLQAIYRDLRTELSPEARERTKRIHVYPSMRCTYTLSKERIFIKVRDDTGRILPECVLRHILLHEMAHTVNPTVGHDNGFRRWLRWLHADGAMACRLLCHRRRHRAATCGDQVPRGYNPC